MMDDLETAVELAKQVSVLPEQYRADAFKLLLQSRLNQGTGVETLRVRTESAGAGIDTTFSEFLRSLTTEPKSNPERFAAVAFYFRESRNQLNVIQSEILDSFSEAGIQPPKNFSRDVRAATSSRSAILMATREKRDGAQAWQLTKTGIDLVEKMRGQT